MQVLSSHFGMYSEFNVQRLAVSLREIICAVVGFKLCETTWNIYTSYPYPTPTDGMLVLFIVDKKQTLNFFSTHLCCWVERDSSRVKYLAAQEHN